VEQKIHVELKYIVSDSFLLVKTSKKVGESINDEDLFYPVEVYRGIHVMNLWVDFDMTLISSQPETESMLNEIEENEGFHRTYSHYPILDFIKENYDALTTLGPNTKGMTLSRVPMMRPRMDGNKLFNDQEIFKSNYNFWNEHHDDMYANLSISSILDIEDINSYVSANFDRAIADFKKASSNDIEGKLRNGPLRYVKPEDLAKFKKLYKTGYNAVIAELKSKRIFDEEKISIELEDNLNQVMEKVLLSVNYSIFGEDDRIPNVLVSTMAYFVDPLNPDFSEYKTLDNFLKKSIEFYMMTVQDKLKMEDYKLLEFQKSIWGYLGNTAVRNALKGDYWKDKDLEYTEKLKSIISSVIKADLTMSMNYGFIWPLVAPGIKKYATENMTKYYKRWKKDNKDFLKKGFDLDAMVYMARLKGAMVFLDEKSTAEIKVVDVKEDRLLI
jgi:hypothetical protein